MTRRGGEGKGAAVAGIGAAQQMAHKQAEQNDGGDNQEDAMTDLPGDLRRLRDQGDGAARHQQDEGDAGKRGGQGGGARPEAGDEDAAARGAPMVTASTRSTSAASKTVATPSSRPQAR